MYVLTLSSVFLTSSAVVTTAFTAVGHVKIHSIENQNVINTPLYVKTDDSLDEVVSSLNSGLESVSSQIKNLKCKVGRSSINRLGLIATDNIRRGETLISVPNDFCLTAAKGRKIYAELGCIDPKKYDGWTGDLGLIAIMVLRELAKLNESYSSYDKTVLKEDQSKKELFSSWISSLPTIDDMNSESSMQPLFWDEADQEIIQSSSTKKLYRLLDDIEEDALWWKEKVWSKDRNIFPEVAGGRPCFTEEGFKWAYAIAMSRCVFVDSELKLCPIIDYANHDDIETVEVDGGFFGTFGTTPGVQIKSAKSYKVGDEVFISYGPKSAAEYLIEHGFIPESTKTTSVAELTFEVDENDRFFDDKLDVLEFETGGPPLEPTQAFDIVAAPGSDGQPDPSMIQFLRLAKLGNKDAFLLESIFRKDVWAFMSYPVSEQNERLVLDSIIKACDEALNEINSFDEAEDSIIENDVTSIINKRACATLRNVERRAIKRVREYVQRESEALDLKEYYQERRLKDLGLDTPWDGDERNPDVGWGARKPGDGGIDW